MNNELKKLLQDLYNQGYQCGLGVEHEEWLEVYTRVAEDIVLYGMKYDDNLVSKYYRTK